MRKITLFISTLLLTSFASLHAQPTPVTGGVPASVNPPGIWTGPTASTSDKTNFQGNAAQIWKNGPLPVAPGQINTTFLSLYSKNSDIAGAFAMLTGLIPGFKYEIKYDMMSASAKIGNTFTDWAYTGEIGIFNSTAQGWNNNAIASNQHQFTVADQSKWISSVFTFTATNATAILGFRALGQTAKGSVVNLNLNPKALQSVCGQNAQASLSKTSLYNKCFQPFVNLNDAFTGSIPQGSSLRWFTNNTHSGWAVFDPTKVTAPGDYYAFIFNGSCFNTDLSNAKVTVNILPPLPGNGQVILSAGTLANECPVTSTVDLTKAFSGNLPPGAALVWYTNPTHSGLPVLDPAHASVSVPVYFAFYYDSGGFCYNTNNSTATVKITKRPCSQAAPILEPGKGRFGDSEFKSDIKVYPNPVSDKIQIESADLEGISQIQIFDLKGQMLYKSGKVTRAIDVKNLSPGTYIVKVTKRNGAVSSRKILVSK